MLGLVRGSRKANRALLQPGNGLIGALAGAAGRHLGSFTVELAQARAGALMESRDGADRVSTPSARWRARRLPERQAYPPLFDAAEILLDAMMDRISPIGGRSMCAGKRACWRRWASAWTCRNAPPRARPTI